MAMYQSVAENPKGSFHFELGRGLAEHLGYPSSVLDRDSCWRRSSRSPGSAISSTSPTCTGRDRCRSRLGLRHGRVRRRRHRRADRARDRRRHDRRPARQGGVAANRGGFAHVNFVEGHIDDLPLPDESVDAVISNGVINLAADKGRRVQRGGAGAASGRAAGDRGHRHRRGAASRGAWRTPTSGPRASVGPPRRTPTCRRSRAQGCGSRARSGTTTGSCPTKPVARASASGCRASPCAPARLPIGANEPPGRRPLLSQPTGNC